MKNNLILLIIVSVFSFNGYAQKAKNPVPDKGNEKFANVHAIKTYERVAEKGYKSSDIFKKLGDSYYYNAELNQAAKWYGELFSMTQQNIEPEYYYRYSQSLRAIGLIDKADIMLEKFNQLSKIMTR
jgi:tetratricopeptide (TPR) repeat protein